MKKIISILLCLNILCTPVLAVYDFSDEAQAEFARNNQIKTTENFSKTRQDKKYLDNQPNTEQPTFEPMPQNQLLYGSILTVPAGTSFNITFNSGINSGSLEKYDRLTAQLTNDFKYNGHLIAPAGSLVYGLASNAKNAGYAYGNGEIELSFTELLTPDGNLLKISTEKIYLKTKSERAKKMTRDIVVGTLGSILIGAVFTSFGGSNDWGRDMLFYGSMGAVGGGLRGTMHRGKDVDIPDGTTIQVKLTQPLNTPKL